MIVALGTVSLVLGQVMATQAATRLHWVTRTAPPAAGPLVGDGHGDLFTFGLDTAGTGLTAYEYNPTSNAVENAGVLSLRRLGCRPDHRRIGDAGAGRADHRLWWR